MFKRNNGWIRCRAECPCLIQPFLWGSCRPVEPYEQRILNMEKNTTFMRQTGADSPAPSQTVHWTVCVPLWRERAVRIPSLREKQKALSPDGERAFCGRSDGIRTHGLLVPNQARYQLRYTPKKNPQQLCCCGGWG